MGELTAASAKAALKTPGRYRDGGGLMLYVREPGKASWVARLQINKKRRDYGLGSYDLVSLAEAREKARMFKRELLSGGDPIALSKPDEKLMQLFKDTALKFLEAKVSEASRARTKGRLQKHAFPKLGKLQLQSVDADVIAECLRPIWQSKPETARKVRNLIIRTLRFGRPDGALLETTLAKAVTDRLPAQPRKGNFAAMDYGSVPTLMPKLASKSGMGAMALRAAILTAARSGEVRAATWSELDLDAALWTIPAERMKMRRPHRVPLSAEAVAVFRKAAGIRRADSDLVFPSSTGRSLSDMTLTKVLRDEGETVTVHGFRSSFRDWAAEQTSFPGEVAEAALSHAVPNAVEAAYRRTDFFDKRRDMMDAWGRFATGKAAAEVVALLAEGAN